MTSSAAGGRPPGEARRNAHHSTALQILTLLVLLLVGSAFEALAVNGRRVGVVTPIGRATAAWVGAAPAAEHDCDVELEIGGVVDWDMITDVGPTGMPNLTERPDGLVSLRGRVDEVDEDLCCGSGSARRAF